LKAPLKLDVPFAFSHINRLSHIMTHSPLPLWSDLNIHAKNALKTPILSHITQDAGHSARLSVTTDDLYLNCARTHINAPVFKALLTLAEKMDVKGQRDRLFTGKIVNPSEQRAATHTTVRAPDNQATPAVLAGRNRMAEIVTRLRSGEWRGVTGRPITHIVHIGIGGPDLGVAMATRALNHVAPPPFALCFVNNVDGHALAPVLARLNPHQTLVIVSSKTMTTTETIMNTHATKHWFKTGGIDGAALAHHLIGLSTNPDAAAILGVPPDNVLTFDDTIGGRFSVWSTAGLALALTVGFENFHQFLMGAADMDAHFKTTPLDRNMPVLLALTHVFYATVAGYRARAVVPYDDRLARFPAYLQQLEMESNGKHLDAHGTPVPFDTAPVVFGEPGTSAQHSFFQCLHQGTTPIPVDFIVIRTPDHDWHDHHQTLLANAVAQADALMTGDPTHGFPGNRPSIMIGLDRLTPRALGALMALYEHKVMTEGAIWGLNSFDQPGVALGKQIATQINTAWPSPPDQAYAPTCADLSWLTS
jgi:glucose-6-phosphate isomerase